MRTSVTSRLRCSMPSAAASTSARRLELRGALAHHLVGRVAPAQAALGDLVQRRLALGGEMAEDPPGLLPDLARHRGALAGHPAGDGDRGDRADAHEALFDDRVERATRVRRAAQDARDDIVGARAERLTEPAQLDSVDLRLYLTHGRADRQIVRVPLTSPSEM